MMKYILMLLTFVVGAAVIHFTTKHYTDDVALYNIVTIVGYTTWATIISFNTSIYSKVKQQQMKQGIKDGRSNNRINRINDDHS